MNDYTVHEQLVERLLAWEQDGTLDTLHRMITLFGKLLDDGTPERLAYLLNHLQKIDEAMHIS
ncbi:hypothetical protein [Alicyclobacillus sp. ALC3]|uniref:hypothetical protein n=1 Tax=Alicyclobacillus sp. ALC3 TaxID=2796143 RepID=UPI002378BD0B|nr:hypothetical protein [Alicyclobacillus sp. ALC3]WDL95948.1 hypothetical protein JC200_16540 [Alicyclobacillus sp. ALC3]